MKPKDFDIQKLVDDLQGTCKNIADFLPEEMSEDDLTEDDLQFIDNEIFLCAECGWWYEVCQSTDKDGENVCDECNSEGEED